MRCPSEVREYTDKVQQWLIDNKSFDTGRVHTEIHSGASLIQIYGDSPRIEIKSAFVKRALDSDEYMMALKILIGHEMWHRYQDKGYKHFDGYNLSMDDVCGARISAIIRESQADFYGYEILKDLDKTGKYSGMDVESAMVKALALARSNWIYKFTVKDPNLIGYATSKYRGEFLKTTTTFDDNTIEKLYNDHKDKSKTTKSLKDVTNFLDEEGWIV